MFRFFFVKLFVQILRSSRKVQFGAFVFLCLFLSPYSFCQPYGWTKTWDFESANPLRIFFIDSLYGWVAGSEICRTSDGGNTWSCYYVHSPVFVFTDRKTGWSFKYTGEIAKSTDSCKTWKKVTSYYKLNFVDASAGNERNICAIGKTDWGGGLEDTTKLVYTNDGGISWKVKVLGTTFNTGSVHTPLALKFVDSVHCWVICRNYYGTANFLYWTSDAGRTLLLKDYSNKIIIWGGHPVLTFLDTLHGTCWMNNSSPITLARTSNGGATWDSLSVFPDSIATRISTFWFPDSVHGWATGGWNLTGGTYKTTDGGRTWRVDAWIGGSLFMLNKDLGWCIRDSRIWRYGLLNKVPNDNYNEGGFHMEQNYPNPFNSQTKIRYSTQRAAYIRIVIYDMLGRMIKKLIDAEIPGGQNEFELSGEGLTTGLYFYQMTTAEGSITKKMLCIK